ncbi:MAG: DUF4173 domain-containing protein [Ignavibacteriales bacterium]
MNKDEEFSVNDYADNFKIKDKNLKSIIMTCLLMAITITLIHNIDINIYIRDIIIPFGIMVGGYIFLVKKQRLEKNKKAYIMLLPIILILLSDIVAGIDVSNKVLNVFILPILIAVFFFQLTNKNYKITKESIKWIFKLFPSSILYNQKYIKRIFDSINNKTTKMVLNILIGSIIGIPIAIIILFLLANADKYFNEFIGFILKFLSEIPSIDVIISNILILVVSFVIFHSIFINLLKNKDLKLKPVSYREINHVIASTILIIINTIFVLFLISEISRLTVNFLHLPIEYTYAEYAREGFFQLLLVTTINFAIILYYIYYLNIVNKNSFVKKLILLLIAFSIILIFNSYYRMFLYIGAYGFTVLRLQVILFLTMELIMFATLIKKIISKLKYNDAIIFIIIMLSFYIINIFYCTDAFARLLSSF